MTNPVRSALPLAGAALTLALCLGGCEDIVYQKTPIFNPPKDSVSGFLGYFDVASGQTTCGNCHSGKQAEWAGTKHSHAWADLQASGHAQASCEPCHTTNQNGNWVTVAAGFNAVPDSAYHDVQCESCHGPGANHIAGPETTQPLPSIAVDTAATKTNGCAECHSGDHNPFAEEWAQSAHGYAGAYKDEGPRDPCKNCHEGRRGMAVPLSGLDPRPSGQVVSLGTYVEAADPANIQPIVCATCHDPHDATNEGQLRAPLGEPDTTQICYRCHHRETEPEPGLASRRGPHGAQGAVWMDEEAGWKPPTWPYADRILPTHASANPRGCAACHVTPFSAKGSDGTTRYFVGHTFDAIPCIDQSTGMPIHDGTCTEDQRYFGGCAVSGCHGSADAARTALEATKTRLDYLTDQLWYDSNANGAMDTTDTGLLPKVLKQAVLAGDLDEMNLYDTTLTIAERAIWNAQISSTSDRAYWLNFKIPLQRSCQYIPTNCSTKGSSNTGHATAGEGAHNPYFSEALLIETIKAVQSTYGLSAAPGIDLTLHAQAPPGVSFAARK